MKICNTVTEKSDTKCWDRIRKNWGWKDDYISWLGRREGVGGRDILWNLESHVRDFRLGRNWLGAKHDRSDHYSATFAGSLGNVQLSRLRLDSSWNVMAHDVTREGNWGGNGRMEWVASTFHTTSEHGVSSVTIADAHTSTASSQLNWCPRRFKWTRPFRRKTKSCFCMCAIKFQLAYTCIHS